MTTKNEISNQRSVLATSGLNAKSITGLAVYQHGAVTAIEITHSTGSVYVKVKGFQVEVGGTHEWGTGTIQ